MTHRLSVLLAAALLAACGENTALTVIAVTITPASASTTAGGTVQFTGTVTGSTDTRVIWSVQESSGGQVSSSGLYQAPATAGVYHVQAAAGAAPGKVATATVTVTEAVPVDVSISPTAATLNEGATQQFTATVTGSSTTAVTWSVQEGGTGGSVSSTGLYTAPSSVGTFHVVATSTADTSKSASAAVTVQAPPPPVAVTVSPNAVTIDHDATQQFTASVTGTPNTTVNWSVTESSGGSVDSGGLYTAPHGGGTFHVVATSAADTTKSASATVTVNAPPVVAVHVTPTSVNLAPGGTQQFSATVDNAADSTVTWSVTGGSAHGAVDGTGLYTAPAALAAGTYTVVATSNQDTSKHASATVHVLYTPPSVSVSPGSVTLAPGGTQAFSATVTGAADLTVTWSATCGAVDTDGNYTAPSALTSTTCYVTATSNFDSSQSDTATVSVVYTAPSVSVSPSYIQLAPGATQQFAATVTNAADTSVTWSATYGTIDTTGLYTAPAGHTAGFYDYACATSNQDINQSNCATVYVVSPTVSVTVTPSQSEIPTNTTLQLTATVTGDADTSVTWSVSSGSVTGSVDANGLFTAPNTAGYCYVYATSHADTSKYSYALIYVDKTTVTVTPDTVNVPIGTTRQFSATVAASNLTIDQGVNWTITEGAAGGSITTGGLYTPPGAQGVVHVVATSKVDAQASATATVTVLPPFPGAPSALVATAGNGVVTLTWSAGSNAASYNVYFSKHLNIGDNAVSALQNATSGVVVKGLINGEQYDFRVTAVNLAGESGPSNLASATPLDDVAPGLYGFWPPANAVGVSLKAAPFVEFDKGMNVATLTGALGITGKSGNGAYDGLRLTFTPSAPLTPRTQYTVTVSTAPKDIWGNSFAGFSWMFTTQAEATTHVGVVNGSSAITLSWNAVTGASGYTLYRSPTSGSGYTPIAGTPSLSFTDTGVSNGTTYYYVLTATVSGSEGAASAEVQGSPSASLPSAPGGLVATATNQQIDLVWSSAGSALTYNISRSLVSGGPYTYIATSGSSPGFVDYAVSNGFTYYYVVTAIDTHQNPSANSVEVKGTPGAAVLPAPDTLDETSGNNWVKLNWSAVAGAQYYVIYRTTTSGGPYSGLYQTSASHLSYVDANASNGTPWYYVVAALDGNGRGAYSFEVEGDPASYIGTQPTTVTVDGAYNGWVQISWPGAAGAGSYAVQRSDTTSNGDYTVIASSAGTPYVDHGLVNGHTYYYEVVSQNNGFTATSDPVAATPQPAAINAPSGIVANPGKGTVTLTWTPVPGANQYFVYYGVHGGTPVTPTNFVGYTYVYQVPLATFGGLTNNTALDFIITAQDTNTSGSTASAPSPATTATPHTPTVQHPEIGQLPTSFGTIYAGEGAVDLTWQNLAGTNTYNLYRTTEYTAFTRLNSSLITGTAYVDNTVSNGATYFYSVAPVLNGVEGPWCPVTSQTPSARAPEPPTGIAAHVGNAAMTVTWDGQPGNYLYYIWYGGISGGPYSQYTYGYDPHLTLPSLGNTTPLFFVVQAYATYSGTSAFSAEYTATPFDTLPSTPSVTTYEGNGSINFFWQPVNNATSYNIYRTSGNATWRLIGNTAQTGYVDSTAVNDVPYQYAVTGVLNGLDGTFSNIVSATAHNYNPRAPGNAAVRVGNAAATVTYDLVPGADYYEVYYGAIAGGPYPSYNYIYSPAATAMNLTSLSNGTPLYGVLRAHTAEGLWSNYSPEFTFTPSAAGLSQAYFQGQATQNDGNYLGWTPLAGADGYHLYRAIAPGYDWRLLATPAGSGYVDTNVTNGVTYYYQVAGVAGGVEGPWAQSAASLTPTASDPLAPTGVVTWPGKGWVTLTWDAVPNASFYYVYSSTTPGGPYNGTSSYSYSPQATINTTDGTPLYYVVTSYSNSVYSGYSKEVTATSSAALPGQAGPYAQVDSSNGSVNLIWSAVDTATSYLVYRYAAGDLRMTLLGGTTGTSYNDPHVTQGTLYYYAVAAANASGPGAWQPTQITP